jgi:hypothetical protein
LPIRQRYIATGRQTRIGSQPSAICAEQAWRAEQSKRRVATNRASATRRDAAAPRQGVVIKIQDRNADIWESLLMVADAWRQRISDELNVPMPMLLDAEAGTFAEICNCGDVLAVIKVVEHDRAVEVGETVHRARLLL